MKNITKKLLASVVSLSMLASVAIADTVPAPETDIVTKIDTADVFKESDLLYTWDDAEAVKVTLADGNITVDGSGAVSSGSVLTITEAGTYVLTGSLSNGQIIIDNKEAEIRIVLNGVNISSDDAAPIYVDGADNAYITVAQGTENTVSDKNYRSNSKQDAVIFAEDDLIINGTGTLIVNAAYKMAVHSENDINICGTVLTANSASSANSGHAILGEDSVNIKDATVTLKSANDGIQTKTDEDGKGNVILETSNINIEAANDCLQAENAFQATDSVLSITSEAGDGIKAGDSVYFDGENTSVSITAKNGDGIKTDFAYDSALNIQNGNIQIMNGKFDLDVSKDGFQASAEGLADDGVTAVDANASIKVFNGEICIKSGGEGLKATDTVTILDGKISISSEGDAVLAENGSDTSIGTVNVCGGNIGIVTKKDALQAQKCLNITGGSIEIDTEETALDSDGNITVSDTSLIMHGSSLSEENIVTCGADAVAAMNSGSLIALDNAASAITFSEESKQPVVVIVFEEGIIIKDTVVSVIDADNNVINSITAVKAAKNLFVSDEAFELNKTFGFKVNDDLLGWLTIEKNSSVLSSDELVELPAAEPTVEPTTEPSIEPTVEPTVEPSAEPTIEPTAMPTAEPTVEPTVEPTPAFETGDLNGDGKINSKDIAAMQKHITETKLLEDEMLIYADISGDGKINSRDIALLQRKILG